MAAAPKKPSLANKMMELAQKSFPTPIGQVCARSIRIREGHSAPGMSCMGDLSSFQGCGVSARFQVLRQVFSWPNSHQSSVIKKLTYTYRDHCAIHISHSKLRKLRKKLNQKSQGTSLSQRWQILSDRNPDFKFMSFRSHGQSPFAPR